MGFWSGFYEGLRTVNDAKAVARAVELRSAKPIVNRAGRKLIRSGRRQPVQPAVPADPRSAMKLSDLATYDELRRRWSLVVSIEPVEKMDTPRGLWRGVCAHADHGDEPWRSEFGSPSTAATALDQHWNAKHR